MVPGIMGILQAVEAVKLIIKNPNSLKGSLLLYDSLQSNFRKAKLRKR